MKQNKFFLGLATIAATVFAFTSCSQDELSTAKAETPDPGQEILLSTNLSTTRSISQTVQENQIANGVQVGVFVNETNSTTNFVENGNNNYFTADGSGGLTIGNADNKIYYPKTSNVDIYAYAPYQSGWTITNLNANQDFTVKADQSSDDNYKASDLIWATPKTNQASSESALALAFAHKLSKININIVNNRTGLSLKGATVSILNTVRTATINPSTGTTAVKDGESASAITVATYGTDSEPTATAQSPATASAIIVPQEIAANTKFIQVITSADQNNNESTTLTAKIGTSNKTFASNKSYNYTLTINDNSVELTFNGTSLGSWEDENESGDLEDDTPAVTYTIGDYVLKDGTFIKAADYAANSSNVAAIIFSTTVSSTDAAAGYNAYAMGLTRRTSRTFPDLDSYKSQVLTSAVTGYYAGYSDLDGRTKTAQMLAHEFYTSGLDDSGKSSFVANMSGYTPAFTDAAKNETTGTVSDWFLPSFGQMRQILSEFGGVTFVVSGEEDPSGTNTGHTINGTALTSWSSGTPFYTSADNALTTLVTNLNSHVSGMFAEGNICFATSTENGGSGHVNKFWFIGTSNSNKTYWMGKGMQRGSTVPSGNNYNTIPVVAVKLPTE